MAAGRGSSASTASNYSEEEKDRFDVNFTFSPSDWKCRLLPKQASIDILPLPSPTEASAFTEREFDEWLSENDSDGVNNIYLHIHDEESRNYSRITTYHGMVRIFNSDTWVSLIFWSLVVLTCLTLFMVYSSHILYKFYKAPTFMETMNYVLQEIEFPDLFVCPLMRRPNKFNKTTGMSRDMNYSVVITEVGNCIKFSNIWKTAHDQTSATVRLDSHAAGEQLVGYALSLSSAVRPSIDHNSIMFKPDQRLTGVVYKQRTSLNSKKKERTCYSSWNETGLAGDSPYTQESCGAAKKLQYARMRNYEKCAKCLPACESHKFVIQFSASKTSDRSAAIHLYLDRRKTEHRTQILRVQTVDVLSAIGGGTSLFLGCSCVTILETFVYLVRSVWQTVVGRDGKCKHFAENDAHDESQSDLERGSSDRSVLICRKPSKSNLLTEISLSSDGNYQAERLQEPTVDEPFRQATKPNPLKLHQLPSVDEDNEYFHEIPTPFAGHFTGPANYIQRTPSLLSSSLSGSSKSTRIHLIDHRKRRRTSAYHTNLMSHF
ncbi:hypothetical protein L596_003750 [Steinernema carpocapsae]|uniref:Uncharacterized protein n=1 Tax=Steinernema carpocapsae TaxID=34508 RepID=A0A4U8UXL4_STECR|nr:hypothetical protein L596_003750 [Steinernema carpocapsae]